jgi:hypothetical protein
VNPPRAGRASLFACKAAALTLGFSALATATAQEAAVGTESPDGGGATSDAGDATLDAGVEAEILPIQDYGAATSDQAAAPRPDNTPLVPGAKGFIAIPGTVATFKVGGFVRLMLVSTSKAVGQQDQWYPSTIPVSGQPGYVTDEVFNVNANQSRLNLDFRIPTLYEEVLRVYYENDFSGTTDQSFVYHLRYFYAQVANIFAGWGDSTMVDVDAAAETLDLQGPNAAVKLKHAQARYTFVIRKRREIVSTLAFALEDPDSQLPSSVGTPRSALPDAVLSWRLEGGPGHLQVSGLARWIGYQDTTTGHGQSVLGWALNVTGNLNLWGRDHLSAQIAYGEGAAAYFADTSGGGYDAALNQSGELKAVPILGTFAAVTHHWSEQFRSSLSYGYLTLYPNAAGVTLSATSFQRSQYASANVVWKPGPKFHIGVEGLYGYLHVISDSHGEAYRVLLNAQYDF